MILPDLFELNAELVQDRSLWLRWRPSSGVSLSIMIDPSGRRDYEHVMYTDNDGRWRSLLVGGQGY